LQNLCTKQSVNSLGGYVYALSGSAVHPGMQHAHFKAKTSY